MMIYYTYYTDSYTLYIYLLFFIILLYISWLYSGASFVWDVVVKWTCFDVGYLSLAQCRCLWCKFFIEVVNWSMQTFSSFLPHYVLSFSCHSSSLSGKLLTFCVHCCFSCCYCFSD